MVFGLRARLMAALAAGTAALVVSVGFVALWAVERRVAASVRSRTRLLADASAAVCGVLLEAQAKGRRRRLLDALGGLVEQPGVLEVALVSPGGEALVAGRAPRGVPEPTKDSLAVPVLRGFVGRRDVFRRVDGRRLLLAYRSVRTPARRAMLRLVADPREGSQRLMRDARRAFWALAAVECLLVLVAAWLFLTRAVTGPLCRLEAAARRVATGDLDGPVPVGGQGEVRRLAEAFATMQAKLRENRQVMQEQVRRLREQARDLEAKQRELQESWHRLLESEKLASVGRLAAGVAHEVGNPLTALLGYVELLSDPATTAEQRSEFLGRMEEELRRMDGIIRALLDFSRPERSELVPVHVRAVATRAAELVAAQKRFRAVEFRLRGAEEPVARAEANRLIQVFVNLFLNAADAMEGRGCITVEFRDAGESVEVLVLDEGPGIPPEVRDKVFDPFFTTKDVGRGAGLGLSVSRSLTEAMGGELSLCDSSTGEGACFRLRLQKWREGSADR